MDVSGAPVLIPRATSDWKVREKKALGWRVAKEEKALEEAENIVIMAVKRRIKFMRINLFVRYVVEYVQDI